MLSSLHRGVVNATLPLLESRRTALAFHFHQRLRDAYTPVVPAFFQACQEESAGRCSLADGVLVYVRHSDQLEPLVGSINQILDKHRKLGIGPEHYRTIADCMLGAIAQVWGKEAVTPVVRVAWSAAFDQLVDLLGRVRGGACQEDDLGREGWRGGG